MENTTLIFIHVPKTAGTSFYDLIERNYEKKCRFVFNINKGKNPIPKLLRTQRKTDLQIIYGHGTFGLHEIFPLAQYVTFVREPVAHTLSNYRYIKANPHNALHKKVKQMSFSEFILNMKAMHHDNQHYRQLTNTLFRIENPEFYQREIVPDYTLLEHALNRVNHIYRHEEIDMAVHKLAQEFNWKYSELPHLNTSVKAEFEIDDQDIENIKSVNYLDTYIYNNAQSLVTENSL
jgi:hypothetical protein